MNIIAATENKVYIFRFSDLEMLDFIETCINPKGLFALESLASGTPVVLPAHGAFPEMLDRLGGGRLVPPDDPEALADALLNLLNDDDTLRSLGRSGQQQVHQLAGMDALVTSTQATYARVLSVPPASP